jgi:hypothetical protein
VCARPRAAVSTRALEGQWGARCRLGQSGLVSNRQQHEVA